MPLCFDLGISYPYNIPLFSGGGIGRGFRADSCVRFSGGYRPVLRRSLDRSCLRSSILSMGSKMTAACIAVPSRSLSHSLSISRQILPPVVIRRDFKNGRPGLLLLLSGILLSDTGHAITFCSPSVRDLYLTRLYSFLYFFFFFYYFVFSFFYFPSSGILLYLFVGYAPE